MVSLQANNSDPAVGPKERRIATKDCPIPFTVPLVFCTAELFTSTIIVVNEDTLKEIWTIVNFKWTCYQCNDIIVLNMETPKAIWTIVNFKWTCYQCNDIIVLNIETPKEIWTIVNFKWTCLSV